MPKLKTNRGAAKRFKETAKGSYKHRRTNRNHILTKKAKDRKRKLRASGTTHASDTKSVKRMLNGS